MVDKKTKTNTNVEKPLTDKELVARAAARELAQKLAEKEKEKALLKEHQDRETTLMQGILENAVKNSKVVSKEARELSLNNKNKEKITFVPQDADPEKTKLLIEKFSPILMQLAKHRGQLFAEKCSGAEVEKLEDLHPLHLIIDRDACHYQLRNISNLDNKEFAIRNEYSSLNGEKVTRLKSTVSAEEFKLFESIVARYADRYAEKVIPALREVAEFNTRTKLEIPALVENASIKDSPEYHNRYKKLMEEELEKNLPGHEHYSIDRLERAYAFKAIDKNPVAADQFARAISLVAPTIRECCDRNPAAFAMIDTENVKSLLNTIDLNKVSNEDDKKKLQDLQKLYKDAEKQLLDAIQPYTRGMDDTHNRITTREAMYFSVQKHRVSRTGISIPDHHDTDNKQLTEPAIINHELFNDIEKTLEKHNIEPPFRKKSKIIGQNSTLPKASDVALADTFKPIDNDQYGTLTPNSTTSTSRASKGRDAFDAF